MDKKTFGARLKELREAAGLSQKALADKAGESQRNIANWELGLREPGAFVLPALADALGVDVKDLFVEPKEIPKSKRGRPRKGADESQSEPPVERPNKRGKGKRKGD